MFRKISFKYLIFQLTIIKLLASAGLCLAGQKSNGTAGAPPVESSTPIVSALEELVVKSSPSKPMNGFATYYAKRFEGRRTTSGHRYRPDKMTAAHDSLPLGTLVRVVNPETKQEVHVVVNDRCARKSFHFIDLSRAAAQKIGLWRKGSMKVVIIPLLEEPA